MKSLLVLVMVCFVATSAANLDKQVLNELIDALKRETGCASTGCPSDRPICTPSGECEHCSSDSQCPYNGKCEGDGSCAAKKRSLFDLLDELKRQAGCENIGCPSVEPICTSNGCRICRAGDKCPYGGPCESDGSCSAKKRSLKDVLSELKNHFGDDANEIW